MISRRTLLTASLLAGSALLPLRAFAQASDEEIKRQLAALEQKHGGRLGVAILDTAIMKQIAWRGDERFPLCSTFKALAAAFTLARVDRGDDTLNNRIVYPKEYLVTYSPITEKYAGEAGMTMSEICDAAITLSDNTAGNLLLDSFGGPAGLTAYLRTLGDTVTRLDRRETELNEGIPGDSRDTTSPIAMAETLRKLLVGDSLSAKSREQLMAWMIATKTGDKRLRAGLPKDWRVGDKTGTGGHNATNDGGELHHAVFVQIFTADRCIRGTKGHGLRADLLQTT